MSQVLLFHPVSMHRVCCILLLLDEEERTGEAVDSAHHINCAMGTQGTPSGHKTFGTLCVLDKGTLVLSVIQPLGGTPWAGLGSFGLAEITRLALHRCTRDLPGITEEISVG